MCGPVREGNEVSDMTDSETLRLFASHIARLWPNGDIQIKDTRNGKASFWVLDRSTMKPIRAEGK